MHFVTSITFLPAILRLLSFSSKKALLQAWFTFLVACWVKRGRRPIPITDFYRETGPEVTSTAAWSSMLENALMQDDEHYIKCQRSLAQFATLYERDPPNMFNRTHLPGLEVVDGSLFGRVASLTIARAELKRSTRRPIWDRQCFIDQ
jgi:hypothetical protein